jgi:hypothetical protein
MIYKIGDFIITKKPHVCGSYEWEVTRIGADVKIKCVKCSREIIMFKTVLDKKIKQVIEK